MPPQVIHKVIEGFALWRILIVMEGVIIYDIISSNYIFYDARN